MHRFTVFFALAGVVGCALNEPAVTHEEVEQASSTIEVLDKVGITGDAAKVFEQAVDIAAVASKAASVVGAVGAVIDMFNKLNGAKSKEDIILERLARIEAQLRETHQLVEELFDSQTRQTMSDARHEIANARSQVLQWLERQQLGIPETQQQADLRTQALAKLKGQVLRLLDPGYTRRRHDAEDERLWGPWNGLVPAPTTALVWDPQAVLPLATHGIQIYLLAASATDPLYHRSGAHGHDLRELAEGLAASIRQWRANVGCGERTMRYVPGNYVNHQVACADPVTGVHAATSVSGTLSLPKPDWGAWRGEARRRVEQALGIPTLVDLEQRLRGMIAPVDPVIVVGRFNADARDDLAIVGRGEEWTIPVALAPTVDGQPFAIVRPTPSKDSPIYRFQRWAIEEGVKVAAADFDGNGLTDIALAGGKGWTNIKVAFSNGDGTFRVTDVMDWGEIDGHAWQEWARYPGVQLVAADFNGDGLGDLALSGGQGWSTVPVAISLGSSGAFWLRNDHAGVWATVAAQPGATLLAGYFRGKNIGGAELALVGGVDWNTVPIAVFPAHAGFGSMALMWENTWLPDFAVPARKNSYPDTKLVGDFDGNGFDDIALALSANAPEATSFAMYDGSPSPLWVGERVRAARARTPALVYEGISPGRSVVAGDFDGDGRDELAVLGGSAHAQITTVLAFEPNSSVAVRTVGLGDFGAWAQVGRRTR